MLKQIKETVEYLKSVTETTPEIGIILGTGLGGLVNEIDIKFSIPYSDIPNFKSSTVEGHSGRLIIGKLSGKNIIAMQGRFHFYEGYEIKSNIVNINYKNQTVHFPHTFTLDEPNQKIKGKNFCYHRSRKISTLQFFMQIVQIYDF